VESVEGPVIWQQQDLKSHRDRDQASVSLELQSSLLLSGDYIARVRGGAKRDQTEEVAAYSFRVLNRQDYRH
jgi:hypothetical protein